MSGDEVSLESSYVAALPGEHKWSGRPCDGDLARLPSCAAVYLLTDGDGRAVQLATTQHLRRLLRSRLLDGQSEPSVRADLAEVTRGVRWRQVYSTFEARWQYFLLARQMHPGNYRKLVSFGPAWFLQVDWSCDVPQIRVTERVWERPGDSAGPWPSRAECTRALDGLWDLFDLCRYPEEVAKTPGGKRCAYADMGRCDAPCDGGVPLDAYVGRTRQAWQFVCGGASEWMAAAADRVRDAAGRQEYERAGQLTAQIKFAKRWLSDWSPFVLRGVELNYLLAIPVVRRKKWKLFLFRRGDLLDGPIVADKKLPEEAGAWLDAMAGHDRSDDLKLLSEQTWLVAHFLRHRDARAAIIEPLPAVGLPLDFMPCLAEAVRARRARAESNTQ